ncbi:MAG: MFS transporter [Verrucomicrobiota bacterium]
MNPNRLFRASCIALIVTAMSFALRGAAAGAWASEFHLSNEQVGWINSTAFWGFTLAMVFGGPLCDALGLGRIVGLAFIGHTAGILLTIFAWDFWSLYTGTLLFGIANGSVEAACNPLIATLYPNDKTTKLNHFHVWFPGGIVIGGLVSFALAEAGLGWKAQFASMLIPLVAYGFMFFGQKLPQTERVQQGVSTGAMWAECFRPGFLLMVVCMLMTAATELGPGQWIPNILTNAGVSGILVLVWITGLMAVGRQFAGPFVHKLAPSGMLLLSAVLSALGLFAMSKASGGMLFAAATVFALGVCFFWPTMLGFVNEQYPKTGALGLAVMGGAGMLSASQMVPLIGRFYDQGIAARLPAGADPATASAAIQAAAGLETLGKVAVLPSILAVVFLVLVIMHKKAPQAHA